MIALATAGATCVRSVSLIRYLVSAELYGSHLSCIGLIKHCNRCEVVHLHDLSCLPKRPSARIVV
jgi:hypothetical protein